MIIQRTADGGFQITITEQEGVEWLDSYTLDHARQADGLRLLIGSVSRTVNDIATALDAHLAGHQARPADHRGDTYDEEPWP